MPRKCNLPGIVLPENKKLMRIRRGYRTLYIESSWNGKNWEEMGRWWVVKDGAREYVEADILDVLQRAIDRGYRLTLE